MIDMIINRWGIQEPDIVTRLALKPAFEAHFSLTWVVYRVPTVTNAYGTLLDGVSE